jgi:ABC-type antimicrobial peptide transport system permease subunit
MTYILQRKLGEDVVLEHAGRPVRLRLVGALADSLFQSELLISERNFLRAFPGQPGYRFFLINTPAERTRDVATALEEGLRDYGFDVSPAADRLAAFHRVENTYISTFQSLGGLGLLLGTLGLAAVMLRNVFERRRELALLRAVGYRPADLATLTLAENSILLFGGLLTGIVSAGVAIFPALAARGVAPGGGSLAWILTGVVLTGLAASLVAVAAVVRAPLLGALRSE